MQRYRWRGNIRELRNTVERLMIMTAADVVRVEDLPPDMRGNGAAPQALQAPGAPQAPLAPQAPSSTPGAGTLREFKDAAERAYLVQKLRENNWNISKTAEVIDTPRSNLYKKLEQYGIKQEIDG
jgi:two-component system nitrogen regulation response regulator NtrX